MGANSVFEQADLVFANISKYLRRNQAVHNGDAPRNKHREQGGVPAVRVIYNGGVGRQFNRSGFEIVFHHFDDPRLPSPILPGLKQGLLAISLYLRIDDPIPIENGRR